MTTILGIDTASPSFALALCVDGIVTASIEQDAGQDHSKTLLAAIARLLGDRRGDLGGIAVTKGPGNYAGLRVGIATAEGLALSAGVPLRGMATLEAVARASGRQEVTAVHPAGRGEFAAQPFVDGAPAAPMTPHAPAELAGFPLAGEGAGALGGTEVTPAVRCRAMLLALLPSFAEPAGESVDAVYLREPNISLPRRAGPALQAR